MLDYSKVKCTGCGKSAAQTKEYDPIDNPVEEDGTYANDKFVCTSCYCVLVSLGLDVGSPEQIQLRAKKHIRKIRR